MTDLDTMYEQVKEYEAKIQAAGGEKAALGRQLEQHEADLEKEEQEGKGHKHENLQSQDSN